MTTTQTQTTPVNSFGFPLVTCTRCDGTGKYGPMTVHGGRCFKCGGTGTYVRSGRAAKAWEAFTKALPGKTTTGTEVRVGDRVVRELRKEAGKPWLTVTAKNFSVEWSGSSLVGTDESQRVHYGTVYLTLSDGTVLRLAENQVVRRFVTADMMPNPRDYWQG